MRQSIRKFGKLLIKTVVSVVCFACFLTSFASFAGAGAPERILSITPAGTEILYFLGLGDRVVGVTQYCNWPPEASNLPALGDMLHVNLEVVMGLNPDLVLVSDMNYRVGEQTEALGYRTVTVYQDDFAAICESIMLVGRECGIENEAVLRVEELIEEIRAKTLPLGENPPRILVVVGRDLSEDVLRRIYVAGGGSFYDDLLTRAGAVNAYPQDAPYANISPEGLLRLDPDVIIELVGEHGADAPTERIFSQWAALSELFGVRAARDERVAVIRGDFTLRAGPRYPQILDAFIEIIHDGRREIYE